MTFLWIPLLIGLLGRGLPVPTGALSDRRSIQTLDAAAVSSPLPVLRWQRALHQRGPLDRSGQPVLLALIARWDGLAAPAFVRLLRQRNFSPAGSSARHFPRFPTGPPSPVHG
jgi:hypothetical protein